MLKDKIIYGSWLFPNEVLISDEARLKSGKRQTRYNVINKFAFLVTNIAPSTAKNIFESAFKDHRCTVDGENKDEPQYYSLDLPKKPSIKFNLMFTIAAIKELNNKLLLRIVCSLCDANKDNFTDKQMKPGEKVKLDIMAILRAKFISSMAFREFQRERLNSLWKMWNSKRPSRIKLYRKSRKGANKKGMILEFSSIKEYKHWKRNMQRNTTKKNNDWIRDSVTLMRHLVRDL